MPGDPNENSVPLPVVGVVSLDEAAFREMRRELGAHFHLKLATTETQITELVEHETTQAVMFDLDCVGSGALDGIDALKEIRGLRDDIVLVAMTHSHERSIPLKASQAGADEFFLLPLNLPVVQIVLLRAIEKRVLEIEGRRLFEQAESGGAFGAMIGRSAPMQKVYQAILAVANGNATVVLRGESGTGKELIAEAIVRLGNRAEKPYICLNCSALPEGLIESELFGYEKGAFTGADESRHGLIEAAHTGTLFLDEITTLNPALQAKLLRALQTHAVQRLGGRTTKKIDFRLICATNDDLEEQVRLGRFREDLYYRINVIPIFVPPLREREGDIPLLVDHFLRVYSGAAKKPVKQIQADVMEIFEDYRWPGNVRELENIVQRLVVMNDGHAITAEQLPQSLLTSSAASQEAILIPEKGVDFDAEMRRIEIAYLNAALKRAGGKKSAAAALLQIDPQRMKYLCRTLKPENG